MKCKTVQELIITEYFDAQMDETQKFDLERHLGCCLKCKDFAAAVDKASAKTFKNFVKIQPPYSIWLKVKEEIVARQAARINPLSYFLNKLRNGQYFPKAAFACALGIVLVVFVFTGINKMNTKEDLASSDLSGHAEYVNYLLNSSADMAVDPEKGYGTKIEEYFL